MKREEILQALSNVIEPELNKDIVSANLIEDLIIDGNRISLTVFVSNPAMHARNRMREAVEFNLKSRIDIVIHVYFQCLQKSS